MKVSYLPAKNPWQEEEQRDVESKSA